MIHRHLRIKANHVTAWTDTSSGIGEIREISLQKKMYHVLIQATTKFKHWEKWHGVVSCVILYASARKPRKHISSYFHQSPDE